jgi:hypothetical protein
MTNPAVGLLQPMVDPRIRPRAKLARLVIS